MKSRTSFFNPTVLKKDITRFAPLWGLYTVFMLLVLFLIWADYTGAARFAANAPEIMMTMGVVNFAYGGLCALLLFGDLFQGKMAGALHAMPMRREGWFLTHLTAGMLFCVGPNLLGAVLASMILQQYCYLAFIWLAIMILQFIFFFGVGAFAIQCAGNKLGATAVYGLFNLLAVLVAFLVTTFYEPVLYGIQIDWEEICKYAPVVGFCTFHYVELDYDNMYAVTRYAGSVGEHWRYLFIAAAVGIALLGVAVWLYRKRHMESAGDFIAVKPVAPVFLVVYTLCVGAVLYFIADQIGSGMEYIFLVVGFALGIFTGSMLLEKKVGVFQLKKWLLLGAVTVVFFLTVAVTAMDPLGITRYVPELNQIKSVQISPYEYEPFLYNRAYVLTEEEDVQAITDIHRRQIQEQKEGGDMLFRIQYTLKNGRKVERCYSVSVNSDQGQALKKYYSSFQFVVKAQSVEDVLYRRWSVELRVYEDETEGIHFRTGNPAVDGDYEREGWLIVDEGKLEGLFEAIQKDCEEGKLAQIWEYQQNRSSIGTVSISYASYGDFDAEYADVTIYSDCVNTVVYLRNLIAEAEAKAWEKALVSSVYEEAASAGK